MRQICLIDGCGEIVAGHGYCNKHYLRFRKYGDPLGGVKNQAPIEERFWSKVDKKGEDDCWLWLGGRPSRRGYGGLSVGAKKYGRIAAHRFSCQLHHGPAPFDGALVMHSCDNPPCVNPKHLRWGTASENIFDAATKGRMKNIFKSGESHHGAVLTEAQARYVKENPNIRVCDLTRMFGCSRSAVQAIRDGRTWRNL
jgi:HNH endonuclease